MYLSTSDLPKVKLFLSSYFPIAKIYGSLSFLENSLFFSEILVEFERIGFEFINFEFEL